MSRRGPNRSRLNSIALRGLELAFWIVFVLALGVGGPSALAGLPVLATAMLPNSGQGIAPPPSHTLSGALPSRPLPDRAAEIAPPVAAVRPPAKAPVIAIVIDDMGADIVLNRRAIALPKAVTLSFLPSPEDTPRLADEAHAAGHEVLVHVPMESPKHDPSMTLALRRDLPAAENVRRLEWALSRVPGAAGLNNHEGSLFTADRAALTGVMQALAGRGLFFLDSRTTAETQVVPVARDFAIASAGRDVFLDDDPSPPAIERQLAALQKRARAQGVAIAIGHPRAATLEIFERWSAAQKNARLIPASTAIRMKTNWEMRQALAKKE